MMRNLVLSIIAVAVIFVCVSPGCTERGEPKEASKSKAAPDFTLPSISGQSVTLSQFNGKKNVLLVFGATWCPHCLNEIPELKNIYQSYKDKDLELLYIDVQESREKVNAFAQKNQIPYPILLDETGGVAASYNVYGIPHTVIITRDGNKAYEGPRPPGGLEPLIKETIEK